MPVKFAEEVARVYGINPCWLLGLSPHKYPIDESLARINALRSKKDRERLLFDLMTSMRGWIIEDFNYAASYGESEVKGLPIRLIVSKGDSRHEFDDVDLDRFVGKMLDYCNFELSHM
jgi:hypothetical protein